MNRRPLVVGMPGSEPLANRLADALGGDIVDLETRRFPDDEVYLRLKTDPKGRSVLVVAALDRPDRKVLPMCFAADASRDLGATGVGLVCPYLPYMRQDMRFRAGEAVTSVTFARILSSTFDWLVTVDPHLHRYQDLGEIYRIPTRALPAAPLLADWIKTQVPRPLLVGPDEESRQWVAAVAAGAGAPHVVLAKQRLGDRDVRIEVPDLSAWSDRTPVLVDDIVSSARTMIEAAGQLTEAGLPRPVCVAVHALFAEDAYHSLAAVAGRVVTTNSVAHETNSIDIADLVADAVRASLGAV
jgi:ribose-phosphate pyrophosphokinase